MRSGGDVSFGSVRARVVKFGGYTTPECRLAISLDGRYFYLTKMRSTCWKGTNRRGVKIICNSDKSVCKTRSELIDFVRGGSGGDERPAWCRSSRLNPTERTICAYPVLSRLDRELGRVYGSAKARGGDLGQKAWLQNERNGCGSDARCIERAYRKRIAQLQSRSHENSRSAGRSSLTEEERREARRRGEELAVRAVLGFGKWLFTGGGRTLRNSSSSSGTSGGDYGLPKDKCYLTSSNYALYQYCNYGKCDGFASNYALHRLCKYDDPGGFLNSNRNTSVRLYLQNGGYLSSDYFSDKAVYQSGKHNGSFRERKNFILYLLSGMLLERY